MAFKLFRSTFVAYALHILSDFSPSLHNYSPVLYFREPFTCTKAMVFQYSHRNLCRQMPCKYPPLPRKAHPQFEKIKIHSL
jgi:hypothetical protein